MTASTTAFFCAPERNIPTDIHRGRRRLWAVSLVLHIAVGGAVIIFAQPPKPKAPAYSAPIKAQIVFPTRQVAIPKSPVVKEESLPPEAITEKLEDEKTNAEPSPTLPSQVNSHSSEPAKLADVSNRPATPKETRSNPTAKQALESYLNQQQSRQNSALAEEAAKDYRRQRVLPTMNDSRKGKQNEHSDDAPKPINVNCSNTVNKTAAVLSHLMGGTLKCTPTAGKFRKFIEARRNQHTLNTEPREQDEKNR